MSQITPIEECICNLQNAIRFLQEARLCVNLAFAKMQPDGCEEVLNLQDRKVLDQMGTGLTMYIGALRWIETQYDAQLDSSQQFDLPDLDFLDLGTDEVPPLDIQ